MKLNSDIDLVLAFTTFPSASVISGDLDDLDKASRSLFKGDLATALNQAKNKSMASLGEHGIPFGGLRGAWLAKPPAATHLPLLEAGLKAMPMHYDVAKNTVLAKDLEVIGNVLQFCSKYKLDPYTKAPWLKKVKVPDDAGEFSYDVHDKDGNLTGTYTIRGDQQAYFKAWVESRFNPSFTLLPVKIQDGGIAAEKVQEFIDEIHKQAENTVAERVKDSMNALEEGIAKAILQIEDKEMSINKGTLGNVMDALKEVQDLLPYTDLQAGNFSAEIADLEKALDEVSRQKKDADLSKNTKGYLPNLLVAVKAARDRLIRAKSECPLMTDADEALALDVESIQADEELNQQIAVAQQEPEPEMESMAIEDREPVTTSMPALETKEEDEEFSF